MLNFRGQHKDVLRNLRAVAGRTVTKSSRVPSEARPGCASEEEDRRTTITRLSSKEEQQSERGK